MKRIIFALVIINSLSIFNLIQAQPLKARADAFPWKAEQHDAKSIRMATSLDEMSAWNRYPTYETYLAMMQRWAEDYPTLCRIDTIGESVNGRLILSACLAIETDDEMYRPEFFYSSTMHGDEVTGLVMMLRLIDTLLKGYGTNEQYTNLIDRTRIYINPLSNPDGTYRSGNNDIRGAVRYNANWVDLNRNYPDPFGTAPMDPQQPENTAMINYVSSHSFRLSANLHGGAEVMNYPWDSFTLYEQTHPDKAWWIDVCKRFVDTSRTYSSTHFRDTYNSGYTAGGDWYVISNGRQDYINYYHNCRELTMELSSDKMLDSEFLPEYWRFLQHSLVNYIEEVHNVPSSPVGIDNAQTNGSSLQLAVYPNPTHDKLFLREAPAETLCIYDMQGRCVISLPTGTQLVDLQSLPNGVYMLRSGSYAAKVVKR